MDWSIHHRIARIALKSRVLDFDAVSEILTQLGVRAADGETVSVQSWCTAGWLTQQQLERILDVIDSGDQITNQNPSSGRNNMVNTGAGSDEQLPEEQSQVEFDHQDTQRYEPDSGDFKVAGPILGAGDTEPLEKAGGLGGGDTEGFADVSTATIDGGAIHKRQEDEDGDVGATFRDGQIDIAFEHTGLYEMPAGADKLFEIDDRYQIVGELGRGGGGRVVEAYDRRLKRNVAMKILAARNGDDKESRRRFLAEAQAACQLEHPNIMPVYDTGMRPDGSVYYTMLLMGLDSLEDVLHGLRRRDPDYQREYSLDRLLQILKQVAQAIDYAHDRGVIHRDLKPGNLMLGEFGEVLVMDWGLAHVRGDKVRTQLSEEGEDLVDGGQTLGTPAYMSPEQARGKLDEVDERSDVYSLGAILYEILVLEAPFERDHPVETMWSVIESELIEPGQRQNHDLWEVPEELETLCIKALDRDQERRFQSAGEFFDELEQYLAGVRPRLAVQHLEEGNRAVERYHDDNARILRLEKNIEELRNKIHPWEPINKKRKIWKLEDQCENLTVDRAQAFGEAVTGFQKALAHDPECHSAQLALVDLYWVKYCEAEAAGNEFEQIYFDALIHEIGEPEYVDRLSQHVDVHLETRPGGAKAVLFPFEEIDRRLVVTDERRLGTTPLTISELEVGRYLLVLDAPGKGVVRAPLFVRRGEVLDMRVYLPPKDMVSPEFCFVAGGPCFVGGDPEAITPRPRNQREISSFFCATLPVTFRQYLDFLNALDRDEARQFAPRRGGGRGLLATYDHEDRCWKPTPNYSDIPEDKRSVAVEASRWRLPIVGISGEDARAYCRWRSERDGRSYRLPTEAEWEKAGRGVDGRLYPWGDHFDATFCKMQQSRAHVSQLEPVGTFVDDASPYGIRDLSGGVREWCTEEIDGEMVVRGGSWNKGQQSCRLASTQRLAADQRARDIGMRLVYDIEFDDGWTGTQRIRRPENW